MKKRRLVLRDSDYFQDGEDAIKLEYCADGGNTCRSQMAVMNENLLLARKFIENKEFSRGVEVIRKAFDSTFDLKDDKCQSCSKFFRLSITNSLTHIVHDLEEMNSGLFRSRLHQAEITTAVKMLKEILAFE